MIERFWQLAQSLLAAPDSNRLAQAFFGMLMLVVAWRFTPAVLGTIPALHGGGAGRGAIRGFLALAIIAVLVLATVVSIGTLVPGR